MTMRAAEELLYDSEATLRLVDDILSEFQLLETECSEADSRMRVLHTQIDWAHAALAELPDVLHGVSDEIRDVLHSLRQGHELLHRGAAEDIHRPGAHARKPADRGLLDRLDQVLAMVEDLEPEDRSSMPVASGALRAELCEVLSQVMSCLQYQHAVDRQLSYASGVLMDMEARLDRLARAFDAAPADPAAQA